MNARLLVFPLVAWGIEACRAAEFEDPVRWKQLVW